MAAATARNWTFVAHRLVGVAAIMANARAQLALVAHLATSSHAAIVGMPPCSSGQMMGCAPCTLLQRLASLVGFVVRLTSCRSFRRTTQLCGWQGKPFPSPQVTTSSCAFHSASVATLARLSRAPSSRGLLISFTYPPPEASNSTSRRQAFWLTPKSPCVTQRLPMVHVQR